MSADTTTYDPEAIEAALARQASDEAHDRSLIVERLSWTPEQRLQANEAWIRFYLTARPSGPVITD